MYLRTFYRFAMDANSEKAAAERAVAALEEKEGHPISLAAPVLQPIPASGSTTPLIQYASEPAQ